MTKSQALIKIAKFCAYQERTQQEVRDKLYGYGLYSNEVEDLICHLIEENFVNEERFAKAFAGGKFRIKKWGKKKILYALKQKGLSAYCIKKGMEEIDETDYQTTLLNLLEKKLEQIETNSAQEKKTKLARYAIQKGYESALVWEKIKELIKS